MLKVVLIIVAVLAVFLVATLVIAATKPDTFRVQRSTLVEASREKLQAIVEDFQSWGKWSPYETVDPDMKRTFSGPSAGKGAVYEWDGDSNIGAGRMEILKSTPDGVEIQFEMSRPMECHNVVSFVFEPAGKDTNVTWIMEGPNSYIGKIMQTFLSMDKMVGTQQEKGLAELKSLAESPAK